MADQHAVPLTVLVVVSFILGARDVPAPLCSLDRPLELVGIETVADLGNADMVETRHTFSIVQMPTALEVNGTPAIPVEEETATKQQILVSRSFHDPEVIGQAVAGFAQRASRRLRKEGEVTGRITVVAFTSPHRPGPAHYVSAHVHLAVPTNGPAPLVTAARAALVPKLMHGMSYMRAGILCMDRATDGAAPLSAGLLETPAPLGELIEAVSRRFGTGTLALGVVGAHAPAPWRNQQEDLPPRYITEWDESCAPSPERAGAKPSVPRSPVAALPATVTVPPAGTGRRSRSPSLTIRGAPMPTEPNVVLVSDDGAERVIFIEHTDQIFHQLLASGD